MSKTDTQRLVDLKAALKTSKAKDLSTLEDFAALWGVTKPRFVNKLKEFARWPDYVEKNGNAYLFNRVDCLKAMIEHIERHKVVQGDRAKRMGAMIGTDQMAEHIAGGISIADLARANTLAAEIEARQRDQGLYVPIAEVVATVGAVFSEISEVLSNLRDHIDPHGKLAASTGALIDKKGHETLLALHAKLRKFLSPDALDEATRRPAGKSRKPGTQRRPSGRATRKAK